MGRYDHTTLLLHKPLHWTSFDVVKKVRNLLKVKKVGHAGTLDPLASGLLVLCTGRETKRIAAYQDLPKTYEGVIGLGKITASYDRGTPFQDEKSYDHVQVADIQKAVNAFTGDIMQQPPIYSALKVGGKRAYDLARRGENPKLAARPVHVASFVLTQIALPYIHFRIICSRGTYIRSIAHDLGQHLGVGGYLAALVRTQIGSYKLDDAFTIEKLAQTVETLH